jgi:hypothetical protein
MPHRRREHHGDRVGTNIRLSARRHTSSLVEDGSSLADEIIATQGVHYDAFPLYGSLHQSIECGIAFRIEYESHGEVRQCWRILLVDFLSSREDAKKAYEKH